MVLGGVGLCALITVLYPIARAFYRFEINYDEGWNVYNAVKIAHHVPLYGAKYAWTTVNYPALSFYVIAYLTRFTHDYLLTGRLLSLASLGISCALVGLIVRKLTGNIFAATFGGLFCLALFCTLAADYVGMDDPQMFAQVFFLAGFLVYLSKPPSLGRLALVVLLFIVGGCIKHNLLEFPIAVLIDLFLTSRRKAIEFLLLSAAAVGVAVFLHLRFGGPFFISNLLASREYSLSSGLLDFLTNYSQMLLPFVVACVWAARNCSKPERRLICLFFFASLVVDVGIAGGIGIAINTYFGNLFAIAIVMGLALHDMWNVSGAIGGHRLVWRRFVPAVCTASLLVPMFVSGYLNVWDLLRMMPENQRQFDAQVSLIRAQPGPAICESLLRCYYAEKPYVFDPFNSTRLIQSNHLDGGEIVREIKTKQFGAIQLHGAVGTLKRPDNRFPNEVLDAIAENYVLSMDEKQCAIYLPRQ